jgi:hypothetical protein
MALWSFCPKNQTTSDAHITGGATWPNDHEIHLCNATFFTDLSSQPANLKITHAVISGTEHQRFLPVGTSLE